MKVLRLHEIEDLRMHEEPIPQAGDGEVLVKVTAVGLCGSDLHWYSEGHIGTRTITRPMVLGHEFAGVVESGALKGRLVAVDPAIPCGHCEFCEQGNPHFCVNMRFAGDTTAEGGLREWINWPERCLFPLPESLNDADGVMLEPMGVALHAINLSKIKPGMTVGVYGCGPIGLLVIQLARLSGALDIYATDKLQHRLDGAREMGAAHTYLADGSESEKIWADTGKRGVDVAFEVAGVNEAVETAAATAKPGGRILIIGIPDDNRYSVTASVARAKGLTINIVRRMKHTYPRSIALVVAGRVDIRSLVTHIYPFGEYDLAFKSGQKRLGQKVVLDLK